jgi:hypothetical protein
MKIVYLIDQPLDAWNRERFGVQVWFDRGWDVEVWDLTPLRQPRVWQQFAADVRQTTLPEHYPIASHRQLRERYARLANVGHYIDLASNTYHSARVKLQLARRDVTRVVCSTGTIPEPSDVQRATFVGRVRTAIERGPIQTLQWVDEMAAGLVTSRFAKPGIVVVSGEKSVPSDGAFELLWAHNLDYDNYLRARDKPSRAAQPSALFIDQD